MIRSRNAGSVLEGYRLVEVVGMKEKIELNGIILGSSPVKDYDKRLVILTKERGKITAFANGARKMNSALSGISEPFNYGTFSLYEGYDAYRFVGGDINEYFSDVKNDIEGICYGSYFCEILEHICVEGVGDADVLNLLYSSLRALSKKRIPNTLIRRIFELRILELDGEMMAAFSCVKCGKEEFAAYSAYNNGLVCSECAKNIADVYPIAETTAYTLQYILSSPINKLYSFQVNDEIFVQLDHVINSYFSKHITKKFKSLEILSTLS